MWVGLMVVENQALPVAPRRCARVLAGRLLAKRLPARTRAHRLLRLILKDHKSDHEQGRLKSAPHFLTKGFMDIESLKRHFAGIGARVKVAEVKVVRSGIVRMRVDAGINIGSDAHGEFFDIKIDAEDPRDYRVVDLRPEQRHLLLLSEKDKARFLCGFDERHWFVCAVPGDSVTSVRAAMEALQPSEVRQAVRSKVKRAKNRLRRRNEAFVRQGEWFFIPEPGLEVEESFVRRNEPLSRGGGSKAHMCQYAYRASGEAVMVCD